MTRIILAAAVMLSGCSAVNCNNKNAHLPDGKQFCERVCADGTRHFVNYGSCQK